MTTLTTTDRRELTKLETIIEKGFRGAFEAGRALREINTRKLYLDTHKTFNEYCEERWLFGARNAQVKIGCVGVLDVLDAHKCSHVPLVESHLRPLIGKPEGDIIGIWDEVIDRAPVKNGKPQITEEFVKGVVQWYHTSHDEPEQEPIEAAFEEAEEEEPARNTYLDEIESDHDLAEENAEPEETVHEEKPAPLMDSLTKCIFDWASAHEVGKEGLRGMLDSFIAFNL